MSRHPLHIQNGNSESSIAIAKLLLAIDAVDLMKVWQTTDRKTDPINDVAAIPMEEWSEISEACKIAGRQTAGRDKERTKQLATQIGGIDLKRCYETKTQKVKVPLQTWGNILAMRDGMRGPGVDAAYATEYFIRHGKFPGR